MSKLCLNAQQIIFRENKKIPARVSGRETERETEKEKCIHNSHSRFSTFDYENIHNFRRWKVQLKKNGEWTHFQNCINRNSVRCASVVRNSEMNEIHQIGAQNFPNSSKSISYREHFAGLCESCVMCVYVCVCDEEVIEWLFTLCTTILQLIHTELCPNAHCTFATHNAKHDLVTSWPTKFIAILIQSAWTLLLTLNKNIELFYREL